MDPVRTFSFQGGENLQNQSAKDLFNTFANKQVEGTPPAEAPNPQETPAGNLSAAELFTRAAEHPPVETPTQTQETQAKPDTSVEGEVPQEAKQEMVEELAQKAKGRPSEKLTDEEKSYISYMIDNNIMEGFEDGKYETKKDLQDLLDANQEKWMAQSYHQVRGEFYQSLPPAMQFVAQYAEMVNDPTELIPFLTAFDNIAYVASLDAENEHHQEEIIRQSNALKGIPQQETEADIADLRERGKLADRAKSLKPSLDQFTQQQIAQVQQQKQFELQQEAEFWHNHQMEVKQAVWDAKLVDGIKLKNEHRDLAFQALAGRNQDGDLLIYSIIDNLVANRDFDTLTQIALLGIDKKAYKSYIQNMQKAEDASAAIRTLKSRELNTNSSIASGQNLPDEKRTLTRPAATRSGFGL